MLKFENLFANFELAKVVLDNWSYDDIDLFKYYRISSNAIYPFKRNGKVCFLRMAPIDEKLESNIRAELAFLQYLHENGYEAILPAPSNNHKVLEVLSTTWGEYYASVFPHVGGKQLGSMPVSDEMIYKMGSTLGQLHNLSKSFSPHEHRHHEYTDIIKWIESVLTQSGNQQKALLEAELIKEQLAKLPKSNDNFGLIHYDFELDNVFFDENSGKCIPIDFDDMMYHWYVMDVERSINSIMTESGQDNTRELMEQFLNGYRSQCHISDKMLMHLPLFTRFAHLYQYARMLHSISEQTSEEPEWLTQLRARLSDRMLELNSGFGK